MAYLQWDDLKNRIMFWKIETNNIDLYQGYLKKDVKKIA